MGRSAHLEASGRAELHGDWAAVATAEEALVALAESPQERVHHLVKLAAVQSKQLADLDAAVALYHDVLALEPAHPHALDALEELHTYREEWVELIDILERRIAAAKSDGRRVQWLLTIAELTERLGDVEGALEVYRRVLAIDPKHAQARDAVKLLDELR